MANTAGERPTAVEPEGAVGLRSGDAFGVGGAGDAREAVAEDRIEADAVGEMGAGHAGRLGLDHGDPAAGDVGGGELLERLYLGSRVDVVSAHLLR